MRSPARTTVQDNTFRPGGPFTATDNAGHGRKTRTVRFAIEGYEMFKGRGGVRAHERSSSIPPTTPASRAMS